MGRSFTNSTRKSFNSQKRDEHVARARWAVENEGIRLRSLASDLRWFEELKEPEAPKPTLIREKLELANVVGLSADELRLSRKQILRDMKAIGKKLTVSGNSQEKKNSLIEDLRLLTANGTLLKQVLIDREEPLTKPIAERLTRADVSGLSADELRLKRNQMCRSMGKIGKLLNISGDVERAELQEEFRLHSMNCSLLTQILIDLKEPLTKPKELP